MKNLTIAFAFLLAPFFLLGQGQRLGLLPTSFKLSKENTSGSVKAFCSDGRARSIPSSTIGKYNWLQNPEAIEVIIDGKIYPDGIGKLIQQGDVIIKTRSDEEVIFELSPNSKIKTINIDIKESTILSDKQGDYNIEPLWLDYLKKLKVVPDNATTFEKIKPNIISFQKNAKIDSRSGYLDVKTRESIEIYSKSLDGLIKNGLLNENFETYEQVIKAYDQLLLEWFSVASDKDNFISRTIDYSSLSKYMLEFVEGNYLINNGGKIEKWQFIINFEEKWEKPLYKSEILLSDINEFETKLFNKVNEINENSKKDDIYYCAIGSINQKNKTVKVCFNGETFDQQFTDDPFKEIVGLIKLKIEKLPQKSTIVLVRDELQLVFEKYDKLNSDDATGDNFLNIQLVEDNKLINYTEVARNLKTQINDNRKLVISSIKNHELDIKKIKEVTLVKSSQDIVTYISPESFGIHADQAKAMKQKLIDGKVKVIDIENEIINEKEINQSNVLILSGHKDSNFELYLKNLAEKGLLNNKVVAIFSCYEQGTTHLNSYLIQVGGAKKIIFFPTKIDINATKAVFSELVEMLNSTPLLGGITLEKAINMSIDRAINKYPDLKNELEEIRNYIPQISFHSTFNTKNNGNG